ncbi:MAG: cyclic nucleotide-binding domain-containing protein [Pseudomonadota bacterium]
MTIYEISGFIGVAFYMGAYGGLQLGMIAGRSYTYTLMNLGAASLVLVSLLDAFNLFSAIIQVSWVAFSIIGLSRHLVFEQTVRFSPSEQKVVDSLLSGLTRIEAKRVLRLGLWVEAEPGFIITRENQSVKYLCWVHSGEVAVDIGGVEVSRLGEGSIQGEGTCLSGEPATATVRVAKPSQLFMLPTKELRRLLQRHPAITPHLQESFATHLRGKLVGLNHRMLAMQVA